MIRCAAALGALVLVSACRSEPSVVAPGLKRAGVERLALGMTEAEVRSLLGAPLNDGATDFEPGSTFLAYARLGPTRLIGTDKVLDFQPGLTVQITLADSRLSRILVMDNARGDFVGCACDRERCAEDWLAQCAPRLPE